MEPDAGVAGQETGVKKTMDELSKEELVNKCKGLLSIAQKAKQAKTELQKEVESFKLQLEKCETEKNTSNENLRTLQELVDSLTEQKLTYITELDSAQSKVKVLDEKCHKYEEETKKCKADLLLKDKYVNELNQKLSNVDTEIVSLKRQNNRLLEENEQLINQLTELESRTEEFNKIGLQQREQLKALEERVTIDDTYKTKIEELNNTIRELETKLDACKATEDYEKQVKEYKDRINEITKQYESEKFKNEKANIKLRSYKDKILKCAANINQLKNSRFILTKTIKEYSANIPKWQTDILNASKVVEKEIQDLNEENKSLKEELRLLNQQINEKSQDQVDGEAYASKINEENKYFLSEISTLRDQNRALVEELSEIKTKLQQLNDFDLMTLTNEKEAMVDQLNQLNDRLSGSVKENKDLCKTIKDLENQIKTLKSNQPCSNAVESLTMQIKSLESEKAMLVKEKFNARDSIVELENLNKTLTNQLNALQVDIVAKETQINNLSQEKSALETNYKADINNLNTKNCAIQEQYDSLKKEHDNLQDLNGLLKEEVETLKLSLEQPKDDADNLSDLNVSLQADIVRLDTKLNAYKQENASLLVEMKESRAKIKEYDALVAEYEETKSKLSGYKTENNELLHEMKEINQVLKERGETISKLQKAVSEMERLIETLEKDRNCINEEKDDLRKKIELLQNELKHAEHKTSKNSEDSDKIISERDDALKSLAEKEAVIESLNEEIEKLKNLQNSSGTELPNEDMSTSTISKAEEHARMKDLDETFEDKYSKIRMFALKLKKKLNETTAQLQVAEQDKAKLEKIIGENGAGDKKAAVPISKDETDGCKPEKNPDQVELEASVNNLSAAIDKTTLELEKVKAELATKSKELAAEIEAHKTTKESLEKARRDVKKKDVLSLEMEDYERSMKELTIKMEDSKKKIVQMESTIDTQEGTITAMKTQIKLLEEQVKSEETTNRSLKDELQNFIEEGKEKDNVIAMKNNIIAKLEQDLEDEKRKNEEAELEMTSVLSEKEKMIMILGEEKSELNNKVKRLEFKCAEINEKLNITNIELADLKTEYTSYKVRAQAVLRQNQTVDHSQEEQLKEEAAALKTQLESLTVKLTASEDQCSNIRKEAELSRRRAAEVTNELGRAQQRTTRLQADLTRLGQQLESERAQHKLQISTLTQCYKAQINELEAKLQKETEALRKQLASLENVKPVHASPLDTVNHNQYMLPVIPKEDGSDGEMDINVSMIPREEGEGSESAPSPPLSKSFLAGGGSGRSPVPLDRLLEEGVPEDEALDVTSLALTSDQEIADLRRKLQAQQQRVKHVTVLLSESERECARMAQLAELLKAELRRVRGAASNPNTEYMKNVTLKFLTLPPGDERSRLVPVLQKILTLTPDEIQKIHAIAKGQDPNASKGWGSFLPWPGGK